MARRKTKKKPATRKRPYFIKLSPTRTYINATYAMRSSASAIQEFIKHLNVLAAAILNDAAQLAKADNRNTIMDPDIIPAIDKHLGRKQLTWQETAALILNHTPAELSEISKMIKAELERKQKK